MILYTNGCSWTYGGGLGLDKSEQEDERLVSVWPHHLGNLLNANKTINLAVGCGSNPRILRTTFDWIHSQTSADLAKTIAVIQWSEYTRFEYYVPEDMSDIYENKSDRWARAKIGCVLSNYESHYNNQYVINRANCRLETYTDVEGMYKHIAECDSLGALFKRYNIKYYYWSNGNSVGTYPEPFKEYMLNNHQWIDDGTMTWNYDRINVIRDLHPSLVGHKQIAEIIYNKIKDHV